MRRAARRDDNQKQIEERFRAWGWSVRDTSMLGEGFPDMVVSPPTGRTFLVEVKNPAQDKSHRRLTEEEQKFHRLWPDPISIIMTIEDVDKMILDYRDNRL